jgi:hypothetical protein
MASTPAHVAARARLALDAIERRRNTAATTEELERDDGVE